MWNAWTIESQSQMQYAAKCIDLHFEATSKESLSKAADMTRSDVQMGVAEADTA